MPTDNTDKPANDRKLKKANRAWIRPFEEGGGARYQQIARQIVSALADGVLRPGDRLPPQRDLAQAMGVDLTTVTRAYSEVRIAGLLDAHGAGGTFIAASALNGKTTVDLGMNIPPLLGSGAFAKLMESGLVQARELIGDSDLMSYHVGAGSQADREAAVAWLEPILGRVHPDRVVICPGAQSAISALLLAHTQPGDVIAADSLTYPGFLTAARVLQRSVAPVESDEEGMLPDALDAVCRARHPRFLYLIPTIHNPTAVTLSAERRRELHAVALRHGVAIIEDDPYWLLAGDAAPPMATLGQQEDGAPVYYVSTLSKCLAPGLRTAYLVVPPGAPLEPVLDALRAMSLMAPQAMVSMASHWIRTGMARDMLQRTKQELEQRQKLAGQLLPGILHAHPHGLHLWLALPAKLDRYRLVQTAWEQGLGVASPEAFSVEDTPPPGIRVSIGGAVDQGSLKTALATLAEILAADRPSRVAPVV